MLGVINARLLNPCFAFLTDLPGYEVDSVHETSDPVEAVRKADGIFIGMEGFSFAENNYTVKLIKELKKDLLYTSINYRNWLMPIFVSLRWCGGNTFRLLKALYDNQLVTEIKKRVFQVSGQVFYEKYEKNAIYLFIIHGVCVNAFS